MGVLVDGIRDIARMQTMGPVIGPVSIGNNTILAQNIVLSGLNHGYTDPDIPIKNQKETTAEIVIQDDCWIGANSVVAGGAVVTKNVPPFTIVGGNPAKILKQYHPVTKTWEKP